MTKAAHVSTPQSGSPPAVTIVELTDPTTANETIEVLEQDVVTLGSQSLRARRVSVRLEGGLVVFHRTNLRVRARTSVNRELVAYGVCGPRAKGSVNGLPMRSGTMLAVQPGTEVVFVSEPGYESIFALLGPDEIEAHLRGRQREEAYGTAPARGRGHRLGGGRLHLRGAHPAARPRSALRFHRPAL
jgi:hypothetical protein